MKRTALLCLVPGSLGLACGDLGVAYGPHESPLIRVQGRFADPDAAAREVGLRFTVRWDLLDGTFVPEEVEPQIDASGHLAFDLFGPPPEVAMFDEAEYRAHALERPCATVPAVLRAECAREMRRRAENGCAGDEACVEFFALLDAESADLFAGQGKLAFADFVAYRDVDRDGRLQTGADGDTLVARSDASMLYAEGETPPALQALGQTARGYALVQAEGCDTAVGGHCEVGRHRLTALVSEVRFLLFGDF